MIPGFLEEGKQRKKLMGFEDRLISIETRKWTVLTTFPFFKFQFGISALDEDSLFCFRHQAKLEGKPKKWKKAASWVWKELFSRGSRKSATSTRHHYPIGRCHAKVTISFDLLAQKLPFLIFSLDFYLN